MEVSDLFYNIGESVEKALKGLKRNVALIVTPTPSANPPKDKLLKRLTKRLLTAHEILSLRLQLSFITFLVVNLITMILLTDMAWLVVIFAGYLFYLRYLFTRYAEFFVSPSPYQIFYYGISTLSFFAFFGYQLLRRIKAEVYYYYFYLLTVSVVVILFRMYFKGKYGRDYTFGIVEEVKNDLVKVFVHDDIAANVKPGYYWVPRVEDAEPGRVVKLLVEDRAFRSSKPVRILEVYLSQSSQTSTEPKNETE